MKSSPLYDHLLPWVVTILVPFALILGSVWIVLHPWFVSFEYATPGFPPDPYGFTTSDRLHYARLALNYLVNDAGISYLSDLHFPDGQLAPPASCAEMTDCTRLYNNRELSHMVDVKKTVQGTLRVWDAVLAIVLLMGVWAWQGGWLDGYRRGLSRGGWLTVILIILVMLFVLLAFEPFFVFFHDVFFAPGTWMFLWSDTLIRLFPERFWQITFVTVGVFSTIFGLALGFAPRLFRGRKKSPSEIRI